MKLEPWYVTGLCDGDGSFSYSRGKDRALAALYFSVKLTEVDRPLLEHLQEYFGGAGTIYDVRPNLPKNNSGWTKRSLYYRVTHVQDLQAVVEHFDRYPSQGRRSEVYEVWRELYEIRRDWVRKKVPAVEAARFEILLERLSQLSPRNQTWSPL